MLEVFPGQVDGSSGDVNSPDIKVAEAGLEEGEEKEGNTAGARAEIHNVQAMWL